MKQRILLVLVALLSIAVLDAAAQRNRPGRPDRHYTASEAFKGIGLTFGYVNSSYRTVDLGTDEPTSTSLLHGFTAGLTKDFTLLPHALYFQTGLNYIYQNQPRNQNINLPLIEKPIRIVGDREEHYLALPLRLKYDLHAFDNIGFTFDAGPTLLCGLSSKLKYKTRLSEDAITAVDYNLYNQKVTTTGDMSVINLEEWMEKSGMYPEGRLGRFDVMLGASVGANFFHLLEVRLGYDWGLINRFRKEVADMYSMHRGQFTLSVGIRF